MKIQAKQITDAVKAISPIAKNSSLPLQNLSIEWDKEFLRVTAFNCKEGATMLIPSDGGDRKNSFRFLISAMLLLDFLKTRKGEIDIELKGDFLRIIEQHGKGSAISELPIYTEDDYPKLPNLTTEPLSRFFINSKTLKGIISACKKTGKTKEYPTMIKSSQGHLTIQATDGEIATLFRHPLPRGKNIPDFAFFCYIDHPLKIDDKGEAEVKIHKDWIEILAKNSKHFITRAEALDPKIAIADSTKIAAIQKAEIQQQVSIADCYKTREIDIIFNQDDQEMTIYGESDLGSFEAKSLTETNITTKIAINTKKLKTVIGAFPKGILIMETGKTGSGKDCLTIFHQSDPTLAIAIAAKISITPTVKKLPKKEKGTVLSTGKAILTLSSPTLSGRTKSSYALR